MRKFKTVLADKITKHEAKMVLLDAKVKVAEAHACLRNHSRHELADEVYELLEKLNSVLHKLS